MPAKHNTEKLITHAAAMTVDEVGSYTEGFRDGMDGRPSLYKWARSRDYYLEGYSNGRKLVELPND